MSTTSVEFRTGKLYGGLWSQYDDELFAKSLALFKDRWLANGEDPISSAASAAWTLAAAAGGIRWPWR